MKAIQTLTIPRQLQLLTLSLFAVSLIIEIAMQAPGLLHQIQAGQDYTPSLQYLGLTTLLPLLVCIAAYLLLPRYKILSRLFMAIVMGALALFTASFVSSIVSTTYTSYFFSHYASQGEGGLQGFTDIANILHTGTAVAVYIGFVLLLLYWRKKNIWKVK